MAGNTPGWLIPYPTGTDRVADGDNAMESLARRVDSLLSQELYYAAAAYQPYSAYTNGWSGTNYYAVRGGWVHIIISGSKASWGVSETICTAVPAGFRPNGSLYFVGVSKENSTWLTMAMGQDGATSILGAGAGGVTAHTSWPLFPGS